MMNEGDSRTSLFLERTFDCSPETLWNFWTIPDLMRLWFGSDPKGTVSAAQSDVKVDGTFTVTFFNSNGTEHTCAGKYLTVNPFAELAFTWYWKGREASVEVVSLEFSSVEHGVQMRFNHQDIDPATSHDYRAGWSSTFEKLRSAMVNASEGR